VTAQGNQGHPDAGDEQSRSFGRVADDGTVYVRVGDTEHPVGQYPEGTPEEALAFFTRRYDGLAFEVQLLEQRVRNGALPPDEATTAVAALAEQLKEPNAVGDITALVARLDALRPVIATQREKRREDNARRREESRTRKGQIVAEAERLAKGRDWRNGANRLRDLLEEWKSLPRLDKKSDDELWHRFSGARTAYTRARKAHFAEQSEKREAARVVKERLVKEAEGLADSTEWGPTSGRYRALMQEWKAAGPAPKEVDDRLWKRFRGAQDHFFGARDAANAELDQEYAANAEKKKALLVEAEALLPVTDVDAAKRAFRSIAERWDAAGKVPRDEVKPLEGRIRKVEQAIRALEDSQWRRADPEMSARADDVVGQLRAAIAGVEAELEAARGSSDERRVKRLEDDLAARRAFLEMAEKAASEFSG
jgi:polyhydroxyalkanoate synthesis regulator phasin